MAGERPPLRKPSTLNGKNNFVSSQAYQMMLSPVGDIVETAHIKLFFVISSNVQYFC